MKTIEFYFFLIFQLLGSCTGAAIRRQSKCTSAVMRYEWRTLSQAQKDNFTAAVNCLTTKPSRMGLESSLYDDFAYVHSKIYNQVHFEAAFLPWHRYFTQIYETALQTECGFTGQIPYWDWTLDAEAPSESPIWDPVSGIGGNGSPVNPKAMAYFNECVSDGPFTTLRPVYLENVRYEHCLNRNWGGGKNTSEPDAMLGSQYTSVAIAAIVNESNDFQSFRIALENGPHSAIHNAIGGDMTPTTSPNDPLFFLHHTQIDRIWWLWQQRNSTARNQDYSGNRIWPDESVQDARITDVLDVWGLAPNVTVQDVMATMGTVGLCYAYENYVFG